MNSSQMISVEVACATPERQRIIELDVPLGTSARKAVEMSGIQNDFPGLDIAESAIGVFGALVPDNQRLKEHDRVEIYRPLKNNPRDARRSLAAQGATMGANAAQTGMKPD